MSLSHRHDVRPAETTSVDDAIGPIIAAPALHRLRTEGAAPGGIFDLAALAPYLAAMTKATCSILLVAAILSAGGCAHHGPQRGTSDWMKAVNSIKPGTAMNRVTEKLGPPDVKRHGIAPVRPYPPTGSPEGVLATLPADTHYQQWIYKRGDSHFHVFFARSADESHTWEVIAVRSAPAAAVN